jgi:hypothetical protein
MNKAFNYAFSKDREGPCNGAAEHPAKKLAAGVESTASVRVLKA